MTIVLLVMIPKYLAFFGIGGLHDDHRATAANNTRRGIGHGSVVVTGVVTHHTTPPQTLTASLDSASPGPEEARLDEVQRSRPPSTENEEDGV
eukprot:CAMPEP_0116861298 /NCGR_PEP_ID=MMETSP0418-20121206/22946_1 /TAXON_ID=1158023 /ORGANISM="Astrosyne radiata, Strain 13vi08-1A" /LENGTH=92 /DNA_ID=CAMNT_0004495907 /DNA_START=416 /DNA_END=694 /DNA_ORIENTATION=-